MARTYTLESVETKIANCEQFIDRASLKAIKLVELREIRANLLSPENTDRLKASLAKKRKQIDNAEKQIAASERNRKNQEEGREALKRSLEKSAETEHPEGWETAETGTEETENPAE